MAVSPNLRCSFDGVAEGGNITAATTSTGSGAAINDSSSTKAIALAAAAIRGTRGARINAAGVDCWYSWTIPGSGTVVVQVYFTVSGTSDPTALQDWVHIRNASARAASLRMTTAGVLQAHDAGGTQRWTSTTKPANGSYILTLAATKGTTTSDGRMSVWLRKASDDSLVGSAYDSGATINTGTADYTSVRFAKTSSSGNWTIDFDEPAVAYGSTHDEMTLVSLAPAPGADAGEPSVWEPGTQVTLDGTASEGAIDTWTWTQTGGPAVTLTNPNTPTPTFTAPAVVGGALLTFTLTTSAGGVPSAVTSSVTHQVLDPTELALTGSGAWAPSEERAVL